MQYCTGSFTSGAVEIVFKSLCRTGDGHITPGMLGPCHHPQRKPSAGRTHRIHRRVLQRRPHTHVAKQRLTRPSSGSGRRQNREKTHPRRPASHLHPRRVNRGRPAVTIATVCAKVEKSHQIQVSSLRNLPRIHKSLVVKEQI